MSTPLIQGVRQQRAGTLQNQLGAQANELGATHGGHFLNSSLEAGDHAAGLVFTMEKLFGINRDRAMPKFGMASDIARKGVTVTDDMQVVKAQTGPGFISKN